MIISITYLLYSAISLFLINNTTFTSGHCHSRENIPITCCTSLSPCSACQTHHPLLVNKNNIICVCARGGSSHSTGSLKGVAFLSSGHWRQDSHNFLPIYVVWPCKMLWRSYQVVKIICKILSIPWKKNSALIL
jgi:hypothetical protein